MECVSSARVVLCTPPCEAHMNHLCLSSHCSLCTCFLKDYLWCYCLVPVVALLPDHLCQSPRPLPCIASVLTCSLCLLINSRILFSQNVPQEYTFWWITHSWNKEKTLIFWTSKLSEMSLQYWKFLMNMAGRIKILLKGSLTWAHSPANRTNFQRSHFYQNFWDHTKYKNWVRNKYIFSMTKSPIQYKLRIEH